MSIKTALDLYEDLLDKVDTPYKLGFVRTKEAIRTPKKLLESVKNIAQFKGNRKTSPGWAMASLLGIPAAGLIGSNIGSGIQESRDKWDTTKDMLTGAGLGLAAPYVYDLLTKGKSGRLGAIGEGEYLPYSDFTSI